MNGGRGGTRVQPGGGVELVAGLVPWDDEIMVDYAPYVEVSSQSFFGKASPFFGVQFPF